MKSEAPRWISKSKLRSNAALLYDAWVDARGDDPLPKRENLHPKNLLPILEKLLMFGDDDDGRLVVRLIGSRFYDRFRFDATGMTLKELFGLEEGDNEIEQMWYQVAAVPCGAIWHFTRKVDPPDFIYAGNFLTLPFHATDLNLVQCICVPDYNFSAEQMQRIESGKVSVSLGVKISSIEYIDIGFGVPPFKE